MKININPIRQQLEMMTLKRKALLTQIDCLQYEVNTLEAAMIPLKEAHDHMMKLVPEPKAKAKKPVGGGDLHPYLQKVCCFI